MLLGTQEGSIMMFCEKRKPVWDILEIQKKNRNRVGLCADETNWGSGHQTRSPLRENTGREIIGKKLAQTEGQTGRLTDGQKGRQADRPSGRNAGRGASSRFSSTHPLTVQSTQGATLSADVGERSKALPLRKSTVPL